jgi:single-strand DNA-binding protein
VGKDPEIRATQNGGKIASFSLATSETWKDRTTGERKEKTEWHRVVIYNEALVRVLESYVKKGSKLFVEGALQTRKWTDNSGIERYSTEIVIQNYNGNFTIIDSKQGHGESHSEDTFSDSGSGKATNFVHEDLNDEVPF